MSRLAGSVAVLACATAVAGAAVANWPPVPDWEALVFTGAIALLGVGSGVTGAVVASRVPGNSTGWIILTLGLGAGVLLAADTYSHIGVGAGALPGQAAAGVASAALGIPVVFGVTGFLLLLFPTGRPLTPRWTWTVWAFGALIVVATVSDALLPGEVVDGIDNPLAVQGPAAGTVRLVADVTDWLALPGMSVCAAGLVLRLHRSRGVERQQLKWFTWAAAIAGVSLGVAALGRGILSDAAFAVGLLGLVLLPVTAGLAILRHRLYDIDLVIKRTLVYATLTATLVATYLCLVLVLQALLRPVAGESDLAVAGSTLAVAGLFRPLRSAIQRGVDRRFFRSRYDAARTVEQFAGRLRQELDLHTTSADLRDVVREAIQPAHVSLWLRADRTRA